MKRITRCSLLLLAFSLAACGKSAASADDAQTRQLAGALTGDAKGDAASNPQCAAFSPAEIATYGGTPVSAGRNAAMGTGCQWPGVAGDGSGTVMLQIVRASDHSPLSHAEGFRKLSDVGTKGFVVPQMGGWQAGAIQGERSINVTTGSASSEAKTIALLREAVKRSGH